MPGLKSRYTYFYRWGYGSGDVGIISKGNQGTDYDKIQDQNIEANKEHIHENDITDIHQQSEIDTNKQRLDQNDITDEHQEEEIGENRARLDANDETNARQDADIASNKERLDQKDVVDAQQDADIEDLQGDISEYSVDGTTFVISRRKDL